MPALPRLVEGRQRAVDDEDVRPLHEAAHEIDAGALLRGEEAPGRSDLMVRPMRSTASRRPSSAITADIASVTRACALATR